MARLPLRRWTQFLGAFYHIDDTIESAAGDGSREAFRRERDKIVDALLGVAKDNDGSVAEEICLLLDAAMAESLVTLRDAVPASAVKGALASGKVVAALGALARGHASARVRGLARDVARAWRDGAEEEVAMARAALDALDGLGASPPLRRPLAPPPAGCGGDSLAATKKRDVVGGPEKKRKKQANLKEPQPATVGRCQGKKPAQIVSEKKQRVVL